MMTCILASSFYFLYEFPDEPGLMPDAGAQEQSILWGIVVIVLVCVLYVRSRGFVLRRLARGLSRSMIG